MSNSHGHNESECPIVKGIVNQNRYQENNESDQFAKKIKSANESERQSAKGVVSPKVRLPKA